jgi:sigma-B regulation protein RsbU (phosphoserine phosphatase)
LSFWAKSGDKFSIRRLTPRTRLARVTTYLAATTVLLIVLRWIFQLAGSVRLASPLDQWISFLTFVTSVLLVILGLRWFRNHVMWSVRNRLIVTYLFIGGVPLVLVLLIAWLAIYFLTIQFAAYLVVAEIQAPLRPLLAANQAAAQTISAQAGQGRNLIPDKLLVQDPAFPGRTMKVLTESDTPAWLKNGFHGLVFDEGQIYLRAASTIESRGKRLTVVSSIPVNKEFLSANATDLGPITLYVPDYVPGKDAKMNVEMNKQGVTVNGKRVEGLSAGTLGPAQYRLDHAFLYYALVQPVDWKTGETSETETLLAGTVRISALFSRLSAGTSQWAGVIAVVLGALAALFAVMMIIAWLIGIRLTRTLTHSVANLWRATEHINRGDFSHRIKVREKDQLAALQTAFNSMTENVERLIVEQKEKERLQSELEIAHEVQSQLFPRASSGTHTLELYGICRPARIVSGDYYDFLCYGPEQVGIAVGDISGKGISAALLMATIHAAVRAYEQEQFLVDSAGNSVSSIATATVAARVALPSPAHLLWLLNRHLYQNTPPEKYATLFLGFYDGEKRQMTYSNAGHLPPVILGRDGSVRRLEAGGMVVGLFDAMVYNEQTVAFDPGDIFIAFSDGMTEPENEFGEFGEDRLIDAIASYRHLPLDKITEHAVAAVLDWIGSSEQPDDITLVLARPVA